MSDRNIPLIARSADHHRLCLEKEIKILKTKIREHGTGNIHTAIHVLEWRVGELLDKRTSTKEASLQGGNA